jgi:hypothetical protein
MKCTCLPVTICQHSLSIHDVSFADTLVPSLDKGSMIQSHYLIGSANKPVLSFTVDLATAPEACKREFGEAKAALSIDGDQYPYGMADTSWWQYCLAPHSYLDLGTGTCQVGLNFFSRFLHLDLNEKSAQMVDPEIGGEFLSTTNWFDHEAGELWFASWPLRDTVHRIPDPREKTRATIWKLSLRDEQVAQIWQGDLGDSLHQLAISPDHRFLVLTELGLRTEEPIPVRSFDEAPDEWAQLREKGPVPSKILVLDLKAHREWRLPMVTAGHVEFDPEYPNICYLSGHNIGLIGGKVGIFGSGCIRKFRLTVNGPVYLGEYTDPCFHRITTHNVFRHRGKTLIAVSGYPGNLFLIEAATMTLFKMMEKDMGETVGPSSLPHLCRQDSYGIGPSIDGEFIMITGTGFIQVASIVEGTFVSKESIGAYGGNASFTGHLGTIDSLRRSGV